MFRVAVAILAITGGFWPQPNPSAKAMFYDSANPGCGCGIHYWLQNERGTPVTERAASGLTGRFTLHIRTNIRAGFLTVWDISGPGRQLTPMDPDQRVNAGGRLSGIRIRTSEDIYVVPGNFEFNGGDSPTHLVINWARSQSEVAHSVDRARARPKEMSSWPIVREVDESTPGQIGTYVINRQDAGVFAEIVFRSR